jgi:aldehyde:ferredoxin oxidoreductase
MLKNAGFDGIILEGVSANPVFLYINDGIVELRDASVFWGLGARETEKQLREHVGLPDAKIMCIGPAGENLVPAAMLVNDLNHSASHSGGAVFGSKKLKGIVVHGTSRPHIKNKKALIDAGQRWRAAMGQRDVEEKMTAGRGLDLGAIPGKNFRTSIIADQARGFEKNSVKLRPCFACAQLCPWDVEINEGPRAGTKGYFNGGSEWLDTFFNLGVSGNEVIFLAEMINDLGIECSHFSCGVAVAFEAWEKKLIDSSHTDGMSFEWGNVETIEKLLNLTARRQGRWGDLIARGPTAVADFVGSDAHKWTVHIKKGTPAMHDWRPHVANMLRELVGSGGMKPQGGATGKPPPDLSYRETWGPLSKDNPQGWAWSHLLSEEYRQFCGISGSCWFALKHMKPDGLKSMVDAFNATTGWNFSLDDALVVGWRASILQSIFGVMHGWKAEDDWKDVGARFLEPVPDGPSAGYSSAPWLPGLVQEYYKISGRDELTGRPKMETLIELGLSDLRDWAHGSNS